MFLKEMVPPFLHNCGRIRKQLEAQILINRREEKRRERAVED